ncbi:hypothetical protein Dxin01_00851 [Deinococcus xinjiangensis]|uniref:CRISPR-associated protein, Csd2 family n=1 Tax=Deinococcus xinjiangensis TaxID=457454 RepID=A0ABP9V754_9DEIO
MKFPELNPHQKHQIFYVVSAHNSNPNGDPVADNAPRTNPYSGHGVITAASIKRKVRDYIHEKYGDAPGMDIFIKHEDVMATVAAAALSKAGLQLGVGVSFTPDELGELLDAGLPEAFDVQGESVSYNGTLKNAELKKVMKGLAEAGVSDETRQKLEQLTSQKLEGADRKQLQKEARPVMAKSFIDARLFGYTAPDSAGKTRGPVQMTDAESLEPVNLLEQSITRVARSQPGEKEGNGNFGRRTVVDHAAYVATAHVNPALAKLQGVTSEDLTALLEGLWYGQEAARSSSRPDVRVEALVIVSHDSPYGNMPSHEVERRLSVQAGERHSYLVEYDQANLPEGVSVQIIR